MSSVWKTVKVGELGEILTGNTPPKKDPKNFNGKYQWIKPTDITIGKRFVDNTEEKYSEKAFQRYQKYYLPKYSTCVVTIGTVGEKICLTKEPSFTNQSINAIIPDVKHFDPLFIYYLMKYNLPLVSKRNPGTASGRHHVSKSNFMGIDVVVPPKRTQKRIANILGSFDDLLENNLKRIEILEYALRCLYTEWFIHFRYPDSEKAETVQTKYGIIPKGWKWEQLGNIADINAENISTKNAPRTINYIDISSVKIGVISKISKILFEEAPSRARRKVKSEDIIWSTVRPIRKSFALILDPEENTVVSTGFAVIRAKKILFTYLFCTITTDQFAHYLSSRARGAAYPATNVQDFKRAPILIPDTKLITLFDEYSLPILKMMYNLGQQNITLEKTRDILIPKLISGELDVEE
jgi:type I restriction enzyme, S subunit